MPMIGHHQSGQETQQKKRAIDTGHYTQPPANDHFTNFWKICRIPYYHVRIVIPYSLVG